MAPDPATSKSRGSRYRSNEAQHNNRAGELMERGSQRSETKGKGEKDGGGAESGRGVKRRQHGGGGDGGQGGTSGSASSTHRSSKRWRGDALETLDIPIPTDRWDGGASDTLKENAFPSVKNKQESDSRSGDASTAKVSNAQLPKEGGDVEKAVRRQKVSKASLVSDNRAITVMDLQETDISIIDANIRIKNKVSYRREAILDVSEPELEQSAEDNAKSGVEASRSRRRWDRDGHKGGAEDSEDAHVRGNVGGEGSQERDREKEKPSARDRHRDRDRDRDKDVDARIQNGRRSGEGSRDLVAEVDGRLDGSDELDHSNDFKIQEELRNIELEKELENRIRRRREESGDRDRWRDDDRERDGNRHSDSRDERTRDERHRSRRDRDRDRHNDRYESRQHREGSKLSEGRQREDRYYESDREYRSHREDRYHGGRSKDLEEHSRGDRSRDQEHRDRKGRESVSGYEADRRGHDKGQKEEAQERERSYTTAAYVESSDAARSEHRHKRARESDSEGYAMERDHSRSRRSRDDRDAEGRLDRSRGSPRDNDVMRGKGKGNDWRSDGPASEMVSDGLPSPRHDGRGSPSSHRMDYNSSPHLDEQRSPRYRSQRSPSSHIDINSAPSRGKTSHADWFEPSNSVSTSSGPHRRTQGLGVLIGDRRDRLKWHIGSEEEVRSGIFKANRGTDDGREGSVSPHRLHDQHLPAAQVKPTLHGQDSFPRGMGGRGTMEARSGGWRAPLQTSSTTFDGGPMDHHGPDDLSPRDRNDRVRRIPMNRPPGSPMVRSQGPQGPQLSSLPVPPLAPLPPPPPFRPGIDNPAVLGPLNGGFDDTSGSRDQVRGDRKGGPLRRGDPGGGIGPGEGWRGVNIGNWNSRNQGPLPGTGFPPFPPQFGHPQAGGGVFPAMGQQFPGPPIFPGGGGRPPLDMAFGGARFLGPASHMGEGGDGYLGHGRGTGWHGPGEVDDGRGPPLLGPGDGWDGPGPHGDDRLRHGRMEWPRGGPMGVRGWERDRERDIWEGRGRDGAPDFMPHRSQMEPPPQNHGFAPAGSGWGMPRDTQVSNEVKPRQERQSFDSQEVKRKPDGHPKPKVIKPSGRGVSVSEGRHTKYATATMQSILSQLDISPDLAGPEVYAQYQALLPASESGKPSTASEEEENATSEPADEDLNLEADPEAEVLIAGPNLLAKLLPPLPESVFEEALRLYRKPETENRVQKSLRGSFVLPFDPSTIQLPSISLKFQRSHPATTEDQPLTEVEVLLDQLDVGILDSEFGEEFVESNDKQVDVVEEGQEGPELLHDVEAAELEDREGEAAQDEFISSHVEVAEYSDREFEAEMEDVLEDDSLKEVQGGGALSERLEPSVEEKEAVDISAVYKKSMDTVDTLVQSKETLVQSKETIILEVDNNLQVMDVPNNEDAVAEADNQVDNMDAKAVFGEGVNIFVVKGAVNKDTTAEQAQKIYVAKEEEAVLVKGGFDLEVIQKSEALTEQITEPQNVQFASQNREEFSPEASVSRAVIEAAGDIFGEKLEAKLVLAAEERLGDALATVESVGELKDPEEGGLAEPSEVEDNGLDLNQDLSEIVAPGDMQNHLPEEGTNTQLLENDVRMEANGKLKELVEHPPAPEQPAIEEPLTRLRKRRASSRLLAQQSLEAQVVLQQEASDGLVGQGSVGIKKVGTRGSTRSSQRKSKRRGSTH